jgi:hypothetical protein
MAWPVAAPGPAELSTPPRSRIEIDRRPRVTGVGGVARLDPGCPPWTWRCERSARGAAQSPALPRSELEAEAAIPKEILRSSDLCSGV